MMAKTGFCHAGLWSSNLLRKGEKILAIDFETANVAPAFVDLGSLLFNWGIHFQQQKPSYLDRRRREVLIESYIGGPIKEDDVESLLFDLEIGFVHRYVYVLLFNMMHSKEEEIKLVEMAERMLEAMERGEVLDIFRAILSNVVCFCPAESTENIFMTVLKTQLFFS